MPKSINSAEELEQHYTTLLNDGSSQASKDMQLTKLDEYKLADIDAINKVRFSFGTFLTGYWNTNL